MESLSILKVIELKQILKQAGMPATGTKSDLIQRILQNGLVTATPSSLVSVPVVPQSQPILQKPQEHLVPDLKEIDEDAILGGDGFDEKTADLALSNEDLLLSDMALSANAAQTNNATKIPKAKPSTITTSTESSVSLDSSNIDAKSSTTTSSNSSKPIWTQPLAATPEEKKQLRAIKFGNPKLQSRAERFGLVSLFICLSFWLV